VDQTATTGKMFEYNYHESNPSKLLPFIDELDIWSKIMEKPLEIGAFFTNSLRNDNNPGCFLKPSKKDGRLLLVDFGDSDFNYIDIIEGLRLKHKYSFSKVMEILNAEKFIESEKFVYQKKLLIQKSKEKTQLSIYPESFNYKHQEYCKKLNITSLQLEDDGTTAIKYIRRIKGDRQNIIYPDELSFAFTFPSKHLKIYQPYNTKFKWLSNIDRYDLGQYERLDKSKKSVIVSKGYFDCRLFRNEGFNSFWVQNESMFIPDEKIKELSEEYEDIIYFYDNDRAGIAGSIKNRDYSNTLTNTTKFRCLNLPISLLLEGITDNKDLVLKKSYSQFKETIHELLKV